MVLRSVTDQAIQAHLQGKVHKKRMQDNDPWQDYECDCGRKLERVKAFQIKQHRESPACREARLHILSQNFMAERVQAVPSDFAFEEEGNPPPVAEADPCVGPAEEVMVEVDDVGIATCPGFCPEQLTPETFYKLYPFAIHTPGGIPNCPPISWLPGHNVVFSVACDGTMHNGEKCCEHCAELKGSEALKKIVEYAIDATPRSDYLRLGVQQLSELLHKKRDQRDDVRLAALNAHRKIVSLRGVADTASKLVIALRTKNFHRVGPFLEHHMSQGHSLRYCVALLEQAVAPQLLHKYTEQERDLALLTLRLGGPRLLHTFYKAGILPSSPFSKQFQRAENPFNLQGHLHRDKVRTLLGSIWSGLERCPIRALKDEASLLPRLSVARDPVENGLFFVGLCDCVKERIPYTGIQSVINVMKHLSNGDWHLARHVSICGVALP